MRALGENVIIEVQAARAGDEVKTESGIVIGRREMGEVPDVGVIVSIGDSVPDSDFIKNGMKVLIPHSRINNVPDPRAVEGSLHQGEKGRQLVATHWQNIQVVYH